MKTLQTLALKVLGFFCIVFALFTWGKTSAKLKAAEKKVKDVTKQIKKTNKIHSRPYVDKPFSRMRDDKL